MEKDSQKEKIRTLLQPLLWDYQIDPYEFYQVAAGKLAQVGSINQERALIRILDRLPWYDVIDLFGLDFLKKYITLKLVSKLRFSDKRRQYEIVHKVLHGKIVSFPGWNSETRQKLKDSLLSHRWYRTEPTLF